MKDDWDTFVAQLRQRSDGGQLLLAEFLTVFWAQDPGRRDRILEANRDDLSPQELDDLAVHVFLDDGVFDHLRDEGVHVLGVETN